MARAITRGQAKRLILRLIRSTRQLPHPGYADAVAPVVLWLAHATGDQNVILGAEDYARKCDAAYKAHLGDLAVKKLPRTPN